MKSMAGVGPQCDSHRMVWNSFTEYPRASRDPHIDRSRQRPVLVWRRPALLCSVPVSSSPKTARTEQLSTTARNQSIWPSRESQSNNAKWIKSQIPSWCQSRNRRHQVMSEPQPSAFGSIREGIPLLSTKIMPARQARFVRRGRPPCGLADGLGRGGSIKFHNASGTSTPTM